MLTQGCALERLKELEPNSVDSIVTDPPAGIAFMGKSWDHHKGGRDSWIAWLEGIMCEALRVLKPGGHALVWALPRTSHWTATALENAGFEIRDSVVHIFGSGFPKSLNVGKAIDKLKGAEREDEAKQWEGWGSALKPSHETWWLVRKPLSEDTIAEKVLKHGTGGLNIAKSRIKQASDIQQQSSLFREALSIAFGDTLLSYPFCFHESASYSTQALSDLFQHIFSVLESCSNSYIDLLPSVFLQFDKIRNLQSDVLCDYGHSVQHAMQYAQHYLESKDSQSYCPILSRLYDVLLQSSIDPDLGDLPSHTDVQECILRYLNSEENNRSCDSNPLLFSVSVLAFCLLQAIRQDIHTTSVDINQGRWPSNLLLSHHPDCEEVCSEDCAVRGLDEHSGVLKSGSGQKNTRRSNGNIFAAHTPNEQLFTGSAGGASRFFYCAKASKKDRGSYNKHPTVKNTKLMEYLITLITPHGGTVLDMFAGSGSTLVAAKRLGFGYIGIEKEQEYYEIAQRRLHGRASKSEAEQEADRSSQPPSGAEDTEA